MKRRLRSSRRCAIPDISLTPLIDTALTLLVIFMVTAPMVQHGIKISLPSGKSKELDAQQELVITINKKGDIFFNSYPIAFTKLACTVRDQLAKQPDMPVYIKADRDVAYGHVVKVVDELKYEAKVHSIALPVDPINRF